MHIYYYLWVMLECMIMHACCLLSHRHCFGIHFAYLFFFSFIIGYFICAFIADFLCWQKSSYLIKMNGDLTLNYYPIQHQSWGVDSFCQETLCDWSETVKWCIIKLFNWFNIKWFSCESMVDNGTLLEWFDLFLQLDAAW